MLTVKINKFTKDEIKKIDCKIHTIDKNKVYYKYYNWKTLIGFILFHNLFWKIRKNISENYLYIEYFWTIEQRQGNWTKILEHLLEFTKINLFELYPTIESIRFWSKIEQRKDITIIM